MLGLGELIVRSTVLFALVCLAIVTPASAAPEAGDGGVERYIVGFHEMPDLQPGDTYLGEKVVSVNRAIAFAVVETRNPVLLHARANLDENVRYVEWDDPAAGIVSYVPNDSRYNDGGHWGSKKIGAETAWDRTLGTTAVKVGVIDSGLLKTHEEFSGSGRVLQGWDFVNGDNNPDDTCGHGTHVTGTIAATINNARGIAGMAQVEILPVKGLASSLLGCSGSSSALSNALTYVADQGAHLSSNSWGGATSTSLVNAIDYSYSKGTIVVAAAGNDGSCTNCVGEPWRGRPDKVIIVSSTTSSDGFSSFSSEGPQIDVAAPGSGILSSYTGGSASYSSLSGTSMAAPHVTGTAALLKTLNPTWGYTDIDNRLKTTAVDLGASGFDNRFGHGRINASKATEPVGPTVPAAPVLSAARGNAQVTLTWTTPANGGASITAYKVFRDGSLLTTLGVVTTYTNTGLTNGVAYSYVVKAVNSVGDGAASNTVTATPGANAAPTACFSVSAVGLALSVDAGCTTDPDGNVASYSWSWGDSTSAGSGATASHTYATDGTYTVTLTVTDSLGLTGTATQTVSVVDDPDPAATTLANGVAATGSATGGGSEQFYKIRVPTGQGQLQVVLDGPSCPLLSLSCSLNLDLYVERGARPSDTVWDCRPAESDSDETCTFASPAADWWYVRVYSPGTAQTQYTVTATYS